MRFYYFFILVFISLLLFNCKPKKQKIDNSAEKQLAESKITDSLINYPYIDGIWITVKTNNKEKVASIIGLDEYETINWKYGFKSAKNNYRPESRVFISPIINDQWVLISGYNLPHPINDDFDSFLNRLSLEFGEAHYYLNHEKTYCIAKSKNGILERFIRYHDIRDLIEKGTPTEAEKHIKMKSISVTYDYNEALTKEYINSPSKFKKKYKHVNYEVEIVGVTEVYLADTISWPGKDYVAKISKLWSFNPKTMKDSNYTSKGLGLYGKINNKF
jgi:hypothetical protein|nr:hypothetical protein [uncultured Psychroserpens sp.]